MLVIALMMKCISDGMDFLGLGTSLFGQKPSSSSSSSTMEINQRADPEPGLKSLTAPSHLNTSCINRANLLPPSSHRISRTTSATDSTSYEKQKTKREFPPPIPFLARTGNLLCHMPWVLKRCHVEGRLVLREIPVKHHEFFKADRSNGRLVLRMMYMDDDRLHPKKDIPDDVLNATTNNDDDDVPSMLSTSSSKEDLEEKKAKSDDDCGDEDVESKCHEENGLDQQKEETEIAPIAEQKQEAKQNQHLAMQRVFSESMIYSSSVPEARVVGCLPKDTGNDFFRIGTPTIRPVYI